MNSAPWQPQRWVANLLFLVPVLGMLYLGRAWLALLYLVAGIIAVLFKYWQPGLIVTDFIPLLGIGIYLAHIQFLFKRRQGPQNRPWYSRWQSLSAISMVFLVSVIGLRSFVIEPFSMPSQSMAPTLKPHDIILATKWGYGNYGTFGLSLARRTPSKPLLRGDIIVFDYPIDPSQKYVKRIVGLPGDLVEYGVDGLTINRGKIGRRIQSQQGDTTIYSETLDTQTYRIQIDTRRRYAPSRVRVPDGHLFVMGDNRDNSSDSRNWGMLPIENVVGPVRHIFPVGNAQSPSL